MFTLDQLRYFVEIASHENVGKASRTLGVSPSTLSQSLANLEAALSQPLFLRSGKAIHLNGAGVAFLKRARQLLDQARSLQADFEAGANEPTGVLRMVATHSLAEAMAKFWVRIAKRFPRLSGDIRSTSSAEVTSRILDRSADAGLRYGLALNQPELEQRIISDAKVGVVVRRDHPVLRHPAAERFGRLKNYPCATPRSFDPAGDDQSLVLARAMHGPVADLVYDSYDVACTFVLKTDAWTFLPDWIIAQNRDTLRPIETSEPLAGSSAVATWRRDSPHASFYVYVFEVIRKDLAQRKSG